MVRFAQFISYLFHPGLLFLLMPYIIVYHQTSDFRYAFKWVTFSSLFALAAFAVILIGKHRGIFSDADISRREERYRFYLFAFCLSIAYLIIAVYFKGIFFSVSIAAFGCVLGIACSALINYFYIKDSIHMAVAVSFVLTVGILYGSTIFLLLVWIIPFMAWSRITLKRHTLPEILVGGTLGATVTIMTFALAKYLYTI